MNHVALVTGVAALLCLCPGAARSAEAAECSSQTLQGGYGFSLKGTNYMVGVPWAIVGRFDSDGQGTITGTGTQSTKGQVSRSTFRGTYQLEPDCSGVATFTFGTGSKAMVQFVVVDSGKSVEMIVADQGTLEMGTATKIVTDETKTPPATTDR